MFPTPACMQSGRDSFLVPMNMLAVFFIGILAPVLSITTFSLQVVFNNIDIVCMYSCIIRI